MKCPYCEFSSYFDGEQIEFHIPIYHEGQEVKVIDERENMREEFMAKKEELFG